MTDFSLHHLGELGKCPICEFATRSGVELDGLYAIDCPRCGEYQISIEDFEDLPASLQGRTVRQRLAASSWVSENQSLKISLTDVVELCLQPYPTVGERAEKLLVAISRSNSEIGHIRQLIFHGQYDYDLLAASWSEESDELRYLLEDYLGKEKGWLNYWTGHHNLEQLKISPKGYDFLDSLRHGNASSTTGFCAMWFHSSVDELWSNGISPAIKAAGYSPVRIDEVEHVNRIDDEIIAQIRRSKFVVADFTAQRAGVYFEAGFALGLGLPVIWTVREDDLNSVHFDNRQYNFIRWTPSKLQEFQHALTARIVALMGEGPMKS